jgi:hypothetical protein
MKRVLYRSGFLLAICIAVIIGEAHAEWVAEGGRLRWRMNVPNSWVGGGHHQITRSLEDFESQDPNSPSSNIFRELKRISQNQDAVLLRWPETWALLLTRLDINVVSSPTISVSDLTEERFRKMTKNIERDNPDAKVRFLKAELDKSIGGYRAATAFYLVKQAKGGDFFKRTDIVIGPKWMHSFDLSVSGQVKDRYFKEVTAMLLTLEYQ